MMKCLLGIFLLIFISFFALCQEPPPNCEIQWRNDLSWNEIKTLAKQKEKNIFIDCYATWCGPCKMMDKQVYTNDSIASYFNDNFISVKLQMDSTSHDDAEVKKWYNVVKEVKTKYNVNAFPTLMFLTPDNILLDKQIGYLDVKGLFTVARATESKLQLYNRLVEFKKGNRDYTIMADLADFAKKVMGDKELSNQIAVDYKNDYLEKLPTDSLLTTKHLQFVYAYPELIQSRDHLFKVYYEYPQKVDSLLGQQNAMRFVNWLVTREELLNKLVKDKKPIEKGEPDWKNIEKTIEAKYPKLEAHRLVNNFCVTYYRRYDLNWSKYAYYKNIRIKVTPPDYKEWVAISSELNDGGAWDVFANCNEKPVLKIALDWINLAIQLEDKRQPGIPNPGYLDTKANVLYKLGEVKQAVKIEQEAVEAALDLGTEGRKKQAKGFEEVVAQMKAGEPTYTKSGAVWDERTMPTKLNSKK